MWISKREWKEIKCKITNLEKEIDRIKKCMNHGKKIAGEHKINSPTH